MGVGPKRFALLLALALSVVPAAWGTATTWKTLGWIQTEHAGNGSVVVHVASMRYTASRLDVFLTITNKTTSPIAIYNRGLDRAPGVQFGAYATDIGNSYHKTALATPAFSATLAPNAKWSGSFAVRNFNVVEYAKMMDRYAAPQYQSIYMGVRFYWKLPGTSNEDFAWSPRLHLAFRR